MRQIEKEAKQALFIVIIIVAIVITTAWLTRRALLHPKPAPQAVAATVQQHQETLTLTGQFHIINVAPTDSGITIALVNIDCEDGGFYTVHKYPTGVHYEVGQTVNAELTFKYSGHHMYKLLDLKIK